ncbi:hypothetical protein Fot_24442 [Forsythia ovata]|uniref:Uncharacterized protein n=1 Tax=Forsythia ovata TaxID=205694 RepID=A0ABD1U678_9LAMI
MGENDSERKNEHLEDSDFNSKRQRDEVPDVVIIEGGEVPRKNKKISIAKTVSNLVKQVQMLVEENRTKSVVVGGQAKNEERNGAEAKATTASHFHLHSDHKILGITSPLTCSRSESVDLRGPSMS